MIREINPTYDEVLVIDPEEYKKYYYTLYAKRFDIQIDDVDILEDDCMIAYSNESQEEIVKHRNKLIEDGYYKPTELYVRVIPNFCYRQPKKNKYAEINKI